jgi:hypothetical protein
MTLLQQCKESECSCFACQSMCRRPCWGTVEEIKKLIDSGYGDRLMADYWVGDITDCNIIGPALKDYEGQKAPFIPTSSKGCTFWKDGLCELHEKGLKPLQARLAHHTQTEDSSQKIHEQIADLWNSDEARALSRVWFEKYCIEENENQ